MQHALLSLCDNLPEATEVLSVLMLHLAQLFVCYLGNDTHLDGRTDSSGQCRACQDLGKEFNEDKPAHLGSKSLSAVRLLSNMYSFPTRTAGSLQP
jgi:hypothetical protein